MNRRWPLTCRVGVVVAWVVGCSQSPSQLSNSYARLNLPAGQPLCTADGANGETCAVSFISLIANPEKYAGRKIWVIGFATLEFEGNVLYLSREAAEINDMTSAIWLDVAGLKANPQAYDHKYVLITGTFNAENRGHIGMFAGTVEAISEIRLWHQ